MIRRCHLALMLFGLGTAAIAMSPAMAQQASPRMGEADEPFRLQCTSTSTRYLPKGNAGVGDMRFALRVDPAAQQVTLEGERRRASVNAFEVSFRTVEGHVLSISRSARTFGYVVPIKDAGADDSRQYILYEGKCEAP